MHQAPRHTHLCTQPKCKIKWDTTYPGVHRASRKPGRVSTTLIWLDFHGERVILSGFLKVSYILGRIDQVVSRLPGAVLGVLHLNLVRFGCPQAQCWYFHASEIRGRLQRWSKLPQVSPSDCNARVLGWEAGGQEVVFLY